MGSAHQGQIRTQVLADAPEVDLRGHCHLVDVLGCAIRRARHHVADVSRHSRQAEHAALSIEQAFDCGAVTGSAHQQGERHRGIEIARAGAHHQPLQR